MHNGTFNLIRVLLLIAVVLFFVILCVEERSTSYTEYDDAACIEPKTVEPYEAWESLGIYKLTAYCACEKCCGYWATIRPSDENGNPIVYTATGEIAQVGTTIAVDPNVIPYGSEIQIGGHTYIAQDTGGAIDGKHIDIYFDDHQEAIEFGVQNAEVFLKTYIP